MVKVTLENVVLAECESPVVVEGNYYFPPESVSQKNLAPSNTASTCPWKGTASYYSADVPGKSVKDVAWRIVRLSGTAGSSYVYHPSRYYAQPKDKAAHIKNYVAFYKNKVIIEN